MNQAVKYGIAISAGILVGAAIVLGVGIASGQLPVEPQPVKIQLPTLTPSLPECASQDAVDVDCYWAGTRVGDLSLRGTWVVISGIHYYATEREVG